MQNRKLRLNAEFWSTVDEDDLTKIVAEALDKHAFRVNTVVFRINESA